MSKAKRKPKVVLCRNKAYKHKCDPYYARKHGGCCFECFQLGVPELLDRIAELAIDSARWRYALKRHLQFFFVDGTYLTQEQVTAYIDQCIEREKQP